MGDSVEGSREVQEDRNTNVVRIGSDEEVVGDLDEAFLCYVTCPETRLKGSIELMVGRADEVGRHGVGICMEWNSWIT